MIKEKTSEWVSTGHPDKTADFISSYILDRLLEIDPLTRYALEVQIKDNFVSLAGEITSRARTDDRQMLNYVREAMFRIGYDNEYCQKWGADNVPCSSNIEVACHISQQSPDIDAGLRYGGWGDQGIFWGMATNDIAHGFMPLDYWYAKMIGQCLYKKQLGGLDIKTQVTMDYCGNIPTMRELVVAIPTLNEEMEWRVADYVRTIIDKETSLTINGTGVYVRHGSMGDCGTTGRKLAVDFYGGNCRIGGGSPWTKDGTKADLSLNLLARFLSVAYINSHPCCEEVHTAISCKIGHDHIRVQLFDGSMCPLTGPKWIPFSTEQAIEMFGLRAPSYANRCMDGLFDIMPMYTDNRGLCSIISC